MEQTPTMEKRNVVQDGRTPIIEIDRNDDNWDKEAADLFKKPTSKQIDKGAK